MWEKPAPWDSFFIRIRVLSVASKVVNYSPVTGDP